jgi:signal transduction histidine kinase
LYSMHLKSKVAGQLPATELSLIDKIIDGINHLSDTVEQVLSFARPVNLTRRPVDLNTIVTSAAQLLEPQINAGRIDVTLNLTEAGAPAALDEAAIRSTVINLMLNSVQAMKDGGKLQVSTTKTEEAVYLEIEDTGCGMTREQIKNVFEPFYTTRSQGLGLGMFHAWKIIEQHGGTILIDSQVEKGTRIKISLPQEGIA